MTIILTQSQIKKLLALLKGLLDLPVMQKKAEELRRNIGTALPEGQTIIAAITAAQEKS